MKTTVTFCAILLGMLLLLGNTPPPALPQMLNEVFKEQLHQFDSALSNLKQAVNDGSGKQTVQQAFLQVRYAYRQLSVCTDYFSPYESLLLNSPAQPRVEDDNPTEIVPPHGLQQLEALIWQQDATKATAAVKKLQLEELAFIRRLVADIAEQTTDTSAFSTSRVWQAMRLALVTLQTKTITAFDSPVSLNAIQESIATLNSMRQYTAIYQPLLSEKDPRIYSQINAQLAAAVAFLNAVPSFDAFDRLTFIRNYINPLSASYTLAAAALNASDTAGRYPVNPAATNLFAKDYFNLDFFSPNKRYGFTQQRMQLGRVLFYDKRLSAKGTRSCAGCHKPELAFTDGLPNALNVDGRSSLQRNTPGLLNAVYQTRQFYDSRQTMLEFQVSSVVHNQQEMGGSMQGFVKLLKKDAAMTANFAAAYAADKEPVNPYTVANAIAHYLRSLQSLNAKFDQYMRQQPGVELTDAEKDGFNLFMGKAKCGTCHFMPLFNGLVPPSFSETESEVLGVPQSLKKPYRLDSDSGRYNFTGARVHLFAFKIPTLRNIVLTAPYMHNGVYQTLEQVIDFYNNGGGEGLGIAPRNQTLPFDKLNLTAGEQQQIIQFLHTLTDTTSYKEAVISGR